MSPECGSYEMNLHQVNTKSTKFFFVPVLDWFDAFVGSKYCTIVCFYLNLNRLYFIHIIPLLSTFSVGISKLDLNQNLCGVTIGWSE